MLHCLISNIIKFNSGFLYFKAHKSHLSLTLLQPCKNGFVRLAFLIHQYNWERTNTTTRYLTSSFCIFNQVYTIHGDKNRSTMIIVCISGHVIHRMSRSNGNLAFKGLENIQCKLTLLYCT